MEQKNISSKLRKEAEEEIQNQFHYLKVKSVDVEKSFMSYVFIKLSWKCRTKNL